MSVEFHSFGWLLRNHPEVHAHILAVHGGDVRAAAENWRDLQEQIQEEAAQTAVKEERVRCLDIILPLEEGRITVDDALAAIDAGTPAVRLTNLEQLPVGGRPIAAFVSNIISQALESSS